MRRVSLCIIFFSFSFLLLRAQNISDRYEYGKVVGVKGRVKIYVGKTLVRIIKKGDLIFNEDIIVLGEGTEVSIYLKRFGVVRIGENSIVKILDIVKNSGGFRVDLKKGRISLAIKNPLFENESAKVETKHGILSLEGGLYYIESYNDETYAAVLSGEAFIGVDDGTYRLPVFKESFLNNEKRRLPQYISKGRYNDIKKLRSIKYAGDFVNLPRVDKNILVLKEYHKNIPQKQYEEIDEFRQHDNNNRYAEIIGPEYDLTKIPMLTPQKSEYEKKSGVVYLPADSHQEEKQPDSVVYYEYSSILGFYAYLPGITGRYYEVGHIGGSFPYYFDGKQKLYFTEKNGIIYENEKPYAILATTKSDLKKFIPSMRLVWLKNKSLLDEEALSMLRHLIDDKVIIKIDNANDENLKAISKLSRLRGLDISGGEFGENAFAYMTSLKDLEYLNISESKFEKAGVSNISYLRALKYFNASSSSFSDDDASIFEELYLLVYINLDDTSVSFKSISKMKNITKLKHLSLVSSDISDSDSHNLTNLTSLFSLNVGSTKIGRESAIYMGNLTSLLYLGLSDTSIKGSELKYLKKLNGLSVLNLWKTDINDSALKYLKYFPRLQFIDLSNTPITDSGVSYLKSLSYLKYISLAGTYVSASALKHLKRLSSLVSLTLAGNNITDRALEYISSMDSIHYLELHFCSISDDGLMNLESLVNLKYLGLGKTPVMDYGIQYLKNLPLQTLVLRGSQITDEALYHLRDSKTLLALDLGQTDVTSYVFEHIKRMENIRYVNLRGSMVKSVDKSLLDSRVIRLK